MTKFMSKTFSVPYTSKKYRDNWENVFMGRDWEPRDCTRKDHRGCEYFGDEWNCLGAKNGVLPCPVAIPKVEANADGD